MSTFDDARAHADGVFGALNAPAVKMWDALTDEQRKTVMQRDLTSNLVIAIAAHTATLLIMPTAESTLEDAEMHAARGVLAFQKSVAEYAIAELDARVPSRAFAAPPAEKA